MLNNRFIYHSYFKEEAVSLSVSSYAENPLSLALVMTTADDGLPFSVATVNLGKFTGNGSFLGQYCAFLDTNNMPDLERFLQENELAEPYTRFGEAVYGYSGFSQYPLYEFNPQKLRQLDETGCMAYEQAYQEAMLTTQNEINQAMFGMDFNWEAPVLEEYLEEYEEWEIE